MGSKNDNNLDSKNINVSEKAYSLKKDVFKVILITFFFVLVYIALYFYNNNTGGLDEFAKYISGFVIE